MSGPRTRAWASKMHEGEVTYYPRPIKAEIVSHYDISSFYYKESNRNQEPEKKGNGH